MSKKIQLEETALENIMQFRPIQEMIEVTSNLYRLGWDERNGGNITYLVDEAEVQKYIDTTKVIRKYSDEL